MDLKLFSLLEKSTQGVLNEADVRLMENVVREHPYFPLPYSILAVHYVIEKEPYAPEWKLKAACMAPDRNLLSFFFSGNLDLLFRDKPLVETIYQEEKFEKYTAKENATLPLASEKQEKTRVVESIGTIQPSIEKPALIVEAKGEGNHTEKSTHSQPPKIEEKKEEKPSINWYLNTFLRLRTSKYQALSVRIGREIKLNLARLATDSGKTVEGSPIPKEEPKAKSPAVSTHLPEKQVIELKSEPKKISSEIIPEPETSLPAYSIGAFSEFSFLPPDTEIDQAEAETKKKTVISEAGSNRELIIEGEGRVLEVKVTPEQLEKYFRPKKKETEPSINIQDPKKEIVERFIQNDPRLTPPEEYQLKNLKIGEGSNVEDENLISETLAQIHLQQGRTGRAIKIYEKLILLNPAKKDYFASQIEKLKRK